MKSTTATVLSFYLTIFGLQKQLFELPKGPAPTKIKEIRKFVGHSGQVLGVAFSKDGSKIATGGEDRSIRLWNTESGQQLRTLLGHTDVVTAVAILPSGDELISVSRDKTARLWDLSTGKEICRFEGSPEPLSKLALATDGQRFLTSGDDNVTRLWDVASGKQIGSFERDNSETITGISFFPNTDKRIFIADTSEIRVWDLGGEKSTFARCWKMNSAALSPDGKFVLTAENGHMPVNNFDLELRPTPTKPAPIAEKKGRFFRIDAAEIAFSGHRRPANVVAISADGKLCLSGSGDSQLRFGPPEFVRPDNTVRAWDMKTGKAVAIFEGHSEPVSDLAISHDGRFAVSASADNTVRLLALPE